ncbi:unnamed protein product [marine sediment metagenome]|uniref:Uncharacterized protein n=1 Tax=marine sediment metagenome TaxID=412755 RepID=X0SH52_9ZZZZ
MVGKTNRGLDMNCPICNEEMFYAHIDNEVRWACIFCWAKEWEGYKRRHKNERQI